MLWTLWGILVLCSGVTSEQSADTNITSGEVQLWCSLADSNESVVKAIWQLNRNVVGNALSGDKDDPSRSSFTIAAPSVKTAGIYTCILTSDTQLNHTCKINVFAAPHPKRLDGVGLIEEEMQVDVWKQTSPNYAVTEGSQVQLKCKFYGHPTPDIVWTRDESPLENSTRVVVNKELLTLSDVLADDRAVYACHASNSLGGATVNMLVRVRAQLAPLWPCIGIVAEVFFLVLVIYTCEWRDRKKELNRDDRKTYEDDE